MSRDMVFKGEEEVRYQQWLAAKTHDVLPALPIANSSINGAGQTVLLCRGQGGVGASMLAEILAAGWPKRPLIIQVGGNRSPVFDGLAGQDLLHISTDEPNRLERALDARCEQLGRVAILELEPSLLRHSIEAATLFEQEFLSLTVLCFIAPRDRSPSTFVSKARELGVHRAVMLRQPVIEGEKIEGGYSIPLISPQIREHMRDEKRGLRDAIRMHVGDLFTRTKDAARLTAFLAAFSKELCP